MRASNRYLLQQFAVVEQAVARFHGIFRSTVESMQIPVAPAKNSPTPMNPVPTRNQGLTVAARVVNTINITPTVTITWRMMGSGALLSLMTGSPARSHSTIPPEITETLARPALRRSVATLVARPPERHRTNSRSRDSGPVNAATRNVELGCKAALATCWRRCSSGSRTSMMVACPD